MADKKITFGKSFAVVHNEANSLFIITRSKDVANVQAKYPEPDYSVWDITGKDEIHFKSGTSLADYTIDKKTGNIICKLLNSAITERTDKARDLSVRFQLLKLYSYKAEAAGMSGPKWDEVKEIIIQRISGLEASL